MGTKAWAHVVEDIWEGYGYSGLYPAIKILIADDIDRMLEGEWRPFIDKGMRLGRLSADFNCRVVERKNFEAFIEDDEGEAIAEMGKFDDLEDKIDGLEYTVSNLEHTSRTWNIRSKVRNCGSKAADLPSNISAGDDC